MLKLEEVARAVRLQQKAYKLLRWCQDTLPVVVWPTHTSEAEIDERAAVGAWIRDNLDRIPEAIAPAPDEVDDLAGVFASFLTTSFAVDGDPPMRLIPVRLISNSGCSCPVCTRLARAPHLRAKNLTSGDKHHAARMKLAVLLDLAAERGLPLTKEAALEKLSSSDFSERAALVTYARQLLARMAGDPGDPAILALWREFAWTRTGAPKKGFQLSAADILRAEQDLSAELDAI